MRYKWCSPLDMQWFLFQIYSLGTDTLHTHTHTHTHRQENDQNEFSPKSSCVLTKGSPDPESGMWWFRLWLSSVCLCLWNLVSVGMCDIHVSTSGNVLVNDIIVCNGRKLVCSKIRILAAPTKSGEWRWLFLKLCHHHHLHYFYRLYCTNILYCTNNHLRVTLIFVVFWTTK